MLLISLVEYIFIRLPRIPFCALVYEYIIVYICRMKKISEIYRSLSPDATLIVWLALWFIINILQATFSGLVDDEAYYHIYAQRLSWGYFDHPPFIALLIWLGEMLCGVTEIGVRLFVVALQPLYLWIFWRTIRPANASREDATLYALISGAIVMMQAYGFIAVPDAPLMFSTALFLWAYKAFLDKKRLSWLWLAIAMAAMAYSKYQGALVVFFAVLFNYKLLLNPKFYLSGVTALVLFAPHLYWQYDNDFPSFIYHLSERNRDFKWSSITEYILNLIAVFNPFFIPIWVQAYRKIKAQNLYEVALKWIPVAIFLFFLFSSIRGRTQPQWMITSSYGLIWILFRYAKEHQRTRRYIMRLGLVTIAIVALLRVEIIFNIFGVSEKQHFSGNEVQYGAIYDVAGDRPVIFKGGYATAAKYIFYSDGKGYCTPSLGQRTHQWQFVDDSKFAGLEALVEYTPSQSQRDAEPDKYQTIELPNGRKFRYYILDSYTPLKDVKITTTEPLPQSLSRGVEIRFTIQVENPYPEDLVSDEDVVRLLIIFRDSQRHFKTYNLGNGMVLKGGDESLFDMSFVIPTELVEGDYQVGFSIISKQMNGWFSASPQIITIQ